MSEINNKLIMLMKGNFISFISSFINVVFLLLLFFVLFKAVKKMIIKGVYKTTWDESVIKFISSALNIISLIFVGLIILSAFNFPVSSIVTIFTALAVGVGISFKESLGNLGAGVILLWNKQFKAGDYISCLNTEGIVHSMTAFTVVLRTIDNKIITIPNSKLVNDMIINFSTQETRRVNILVTLPYGSDIDDVKQIISQILENDDRVIKDPGYTIGVKNLTDKGIELLIAPWVEIDDYWTVYYDLMDAIVSQINNKNIKAPRLQVEMIKTKKGS